MARYFATVARGLEPLAAEELASLGADSVEPGFCGVAFGGDRALLYRANLWARLPFRILMTLGTVPAANADRLYQGVQSINWEPFLTPDQTLAVTATGKNSHLNHTHYTALQVKNAIVDQQRQHWGERSGVDTEAPDVRINVHIEQHQAVVSLDSSGSSLHRRGYRPAMGKAPLKESLAAAILKLTGWQPDLPLIDPLCGSGTLPLEAALMGLNIAPGLFRSHFGFETWQDYDFDLWQRLIQEAEDAQQPALAVPIVGCDRDPDTLQQARTNAQTCGVDQQIAFQLKDLAQVEPPADHGILVCNPPYGERLGKDEDLGSLYKLLGDVLKQRFKGWKAYVLSGNKALSKHIGLKSSRRFPLNNGSIPCQLMEYELY